MVFSPEENVPGAGSRFCEIEHKACNKVSRAPRNVFRKTGQAWKLE
jgi:hypothetical protein